MEPVKGLLDFTKSPMGQGLLAAGFAGLAGANRNTPINNIGRAGLAGLTGYSAASALGEERKKREEAEKIKATIPTLYTQGEDGTMQLNTMEAIKIMGPEQVMQYAKIPGLNRQKVARTQEVEGPNGGKQIVQLDEYGNPVGQTLTGYVPPQVVDTGDKKQFVTPVSGLSFNVGMSPSERDSSARGWQSVGLRQEANDLSRQRLQFDKGQQQGGYSTKPLPAVAVKIQDEALGVLGAAGTLDQILSEKDRQIESGTLNFGPVDNLVNKARNAAGFSSEESRNLASFQSDMERMRNESLRLNSGVQTDGDAQRAWNELFQNINDPELVRQRIQEIRSINKRAVELQRLRIDGVRSNYNAAPYDFSKYDKPTEAPQSAPLTFSDPGKEASYQEWKRQQGVQ